MSKTLKFILGLLESLNSEYEILFNSNVSPPLKLIQGLFFLACLHVLSLAIKILEIHEILLQKMR